MTRSAFVLKASGIETFGPANGLDPAAGPGLVFISLPIAFGQMPGRLVFDTLFFLPLIFCRIDLDYRGAGAHLWAGAETRQ